MRPQYDTYNVLDPIYITKETNTYEITSNPRGIKGWFQKQCFKFLERTGYVKRHMSWEYNDLGVDTVSIDMWDLENHILDYIMSVEKRYINHTPEKIVVGLDVWQTFTKATRSSTYMASVTLDSNRLFHGIPIQFVPWINGIVIIPKER